MRKQQAKAKYRINLKLFRFSESFRRFRTDAQCRNGADSNGIYRARVNRYDRA